MTFDSLSTKASTRRREIFGFCRNGIFSTIPRYRHSFTSAWSDGLRSLTKLCSMAEP